MYGEFKDLKLIGKILHRRKVKLAAKRWRQPSLVDRLRAWRRLQVVKLFDDIFAISPSGGVGFAVAWWPANFMFLASKSNLGFYKQRTVHLGIRARLHPHWYRRLGAVCLRMNRFFLDIQTRNDLANDCLWGLEVRKGRGYTFTCSWVPFTRKEIKENDLDELEPWQTDGLLGIDPPTAEPGLGGTVVARERYHQTQQSVPGVPSGGRGWR